MDPQPSRPVGHRDDEVGRQRLKHRAALAGRPVPGSSTKTVGELAEEARAALSAGTGADDAQRFLAERGHSPTTIAAVLSCLDLVASEGVGNRGAVTPMPESSAHERRLRRLAELEAMLPEE